MALIFISYCRDNHEKANSFAKDLEKLGHQYWLDQALTGGQDWWNLILSEIRRCDIFAFALDPEAQESQACNLEYKYARQLGKNILPIIIADGVSLELLPSDLVQIQFVDYRLSDKAAIFALSDAIKAFPSTPGLPDPLPESPDPPLSYLGDIAQQLDAPSLSFDQQTLLLARLRTALREPKTAAGARILLKKFRPRYDLIATIREDIDVLLAATVQDAGPPIVSRNWKTKILLFLGFGVQKNPAKPVVDEPYVGVISLKQVWLSLIGGLLISGVLERVLPAESYLVVGPHTFFTKPSWSLPAAVLLCISIIWKKLAFRPAYARVALIIFPPVLGFAIRSFPTFRNWESGLSGAVFSLVIVILVFWKETPSSPLAMKNACMSLAGGMALLIVAGFYAPRYLLVVSLLEDVLAVAFAVYAVILLVWTLVALIKKRKAR